MEPGILYENKGTIVISKKDMKIKNQIRDGP